MKNVDVNKQQNSGDTPLLIASYKGHKDIVELLLNMNNIDVNKATNTGLTPLSIAKDAILSLTLITHISA